MLKTLCAFTLIIAFSINSVSSQGIEFTAGYGIMNYQGDLQSKPFTFSQAQQAFTGAIKFPINDYIKGRVGLTFGSVGADDKYNTSPQKERNLNFKSNIDEFHFILEFHFLKNIDNKLSPYLLAGMGVFHFNPYTRDDVQGRIFLKPLSTEGEGLPEYPDRKPYSLIQPSLPFGAGISYQISCSFSLSLEFIERKLFTDYLDDVSKGYVDYNTLLKAKGPLATKLAYRGIGGYPTDVNMAYKRGNPKNKDWYYTGMVNITYSFNNCNTRFKWNKKLSGTGCPDL